MPGKCWPCISGWASFGGWSTCSESPEGRKHISPGQSPGSTARNIRPGRQKTGCTAAGLGRMSKLLRTLSREGELLFFFFAAADDDFLLDRLGNLLVAVE